ncbi:MAG TPA: hydroxymethylbilane synthase [Thermodesulfovibrio thiophilus]|uniref:hydroxymethylbilane synthase n=1 Tax=Thermodesulfovibrio thiophilus TaxID=340095 RepID=UPI0018426981|nr:hydroxymethylbilane synthase [Thermodesulfovibrio thiophilus]HOA83332.1 hydroxymethylbilane synthase [Thermodesulfovibrio thiophilus]HQA04079.1 hydroxymethylbilane synthase [Thermodesulfovibrio thiophilus]
MTKNKIIIGTRGSKLALWQANWIKDKLERLYPDLVIAIEKIKTTGDKITDAPLSRIGGKGLFVKEIEEALFKSRIDIAVHSMKDVPAELPEGLHIAAICERENPRDAIISNNNKSLKELPDGAVLGTSSLRRTVQLKAIRTDFNIKPLRGNVDTRINKLKNGDFDAIILAMAGIKRMGLENLITEVISEDTMIPAIGQGAIGIETRVDDEFINEIIKPLNHEDTAICVLAERAFLSIMGGGCQVPLACHAKILKQNNKTTINIEGILGDPDGKWSIIRGSRNGSLSQANILAEDLARELLDKGGNPKLLVE